MAHSQEEGREAAKSGNVDPEVLAFLPIIASHPSLLFLEVPVQLSAVDQRGNDDSSAVGSVDVSTDFSRPVQDDGLTGMPIQSSGHSGRMYPSKL